MWVTCYMLNEDGGTCSVNQTADFSRFGFQKILLAGSHPVFVNVVNYADGSWRCFGHRRMQRSLLLSTRVGFSDGAPILHLVQVRAKSVLHGPNSLACSIMEKVFTGFDECPRILLSCFRARNSGRVSHIARWKRKRRSRELCCVVRF